MSETFGTLSAIVAAKSPARPPLRAIRPPVPPLTVTRPPPSDRLRFATATRRTAVSAAGPVPPGAPSEPSVLIDSKAKSPLSVWPASAELDAGAGDPQVRAGDQLQRDVLAADGQRRVDRGVGRVDREGERAGEARVAREA